MKSQDIHIAFLRGINVSGKNKIQMKALTSLLEDLGCRHVQTYIQSGNVVFEKKIKNNTQFAKEVEQAILNAFGLDVPVLILKGQELENILLKQPYCQKVKDDPSGCYYTLMFETIDPKAEPALPAESQDLYQYGEKVIYLYCPQGYGKTKWNNNYFEKKLKVKATTRNHATMNTLWEMCQTN